ncbi:DgyrCDS5454 [Dimorphilus gyrociliatus]|uniref:DgyrCDS5454 n=1 Tax=Dimorphilus gyrociliatus TaxID=2664684 RepID=A0A7I8VJW9_9ANNE|nr:DgyrCDS5454 [Dimorphilus gyrociliatus]
MDRQTRRKLVKTAVEKRRRERINNCLEQIRKLVLTAAGQRPEDQETMEKAEILELAVQHLTGYVKRISKDMEVRRHMYVNCQPYGQVYNANYRPPLSDIRNTKRKLSYGNEENKENIENERVWRPW